MRSSLTLIIAFNLLNINHLYAEDVQLEACQAALAKKQWTQAVQAAEKSPNNANAWLCKGRAQTAMQQREAAQQSFEHAITLKPDGLDLISAYLLLGNTQHALKQNEAALATYEQALHLSKQEKIKRYAMVTHNLKGETLLELGQYQPALEAFQAGEKLAMNDNERADSYEHEAQAYQKLQQLDKAVEYQLKAVLMQKKSGEPDQYAEASLTLGELFVAQKDYISADRTYQRLMDYAHDNGGAFYEAKAAIYLAGVRKLNGDPASAAQLIQQAESLAAKLHDAELDALLAKAK